MKAMAQERNKKFPNFWQAIVVVIVLVFFEILAGTLLEFAGLNFNSGDPRGSAGTVLAAGILLSLLLAYKGLNYRQLFNPGGQEPGLTVSPILPALLILCFGQFILTWELSNLVFRLLPMSDGQASSMTELLSGGLVSFVTLCLIAPFIEEMLFRGVFLRGFLNNYSPLLAIALSSVVFGLAHYYLNHIIVATAIGFVLGWLYYTTRSLWPSIIAHAIQNGTSLLSVEMAPESMSEPDPVLFPVTSVPAVLFGIAALVYGFRQIRSISNRAPPIA